MSANNKTVLVTGAGQGIGRGIALAFAREGYQVVISDINEVNLSLVSKEITDLGVKNLIIKCDVSKKSEVDEMINRVVKEMGSLDVLVNNAGIYPFTPFIEMTEEAWDKVIDVNLKSVFLCSQAAAKVMPLGSRIINISSIAAVVGFSGLAHYCASKGGVNSLIRTLALELAEKKITVNAVAPGGIQTPGASQGANEEISKQTISMIPLGRMGQAEDIAGAATFLASDQASYITGQTLIVDGGWTLR